jgi:SAM-dependent methyltransferase
LSQAAVSAGPEQPSAGSPEGGSGHLRAAGGTYGRVLAYLDPAILALWTLGAGPRILLFRWYVKLFGFPELAAHRRFRQVQEALRRTGGVVVLDLGAGAGLYSIADAIRRPGGLHFLADLSFRHIRRANVTGRALNLPMFGLVCSGEAMPLAARTVDAVLLIEVLQFVRNDVAVIAEIGRVLRPGGVWVCEQECAPAAARVSDGTRSGDQEDRLTKRRAGYTPDRLRNLAGGSGLVLESSEPVAGRISRWWEGLEARILCRSRLLHLMLFPLIRVLARLAVLSPLEAEVGTMLYVFRRAGSKPAAPSSFPRNDSDANHIQ